MSAKPRTSNVYEFTRPTPLRVEIHAQDCGCGDCEPLGTRLTDRAIAGWCAAGLVLGHAAAFAYDPAGMLGVWRSMVGL